MSAYSQSMTQDAINAAPEQEETLTALLATLEAATAAYAPLRLVQTEQAYINASAGDYASREAARAQYRSDVNAARIALEAARDTWSSAVVGILR